MNLYNTLALLGVIEALEKPGRFLLDTYFPDEQTFDTEEVYWDKIDRARRLAPLVSPMVEGKPMRSRGYATKSVTPGYVKPKHPVEPAKALKRRAGERIGGELTAEQRFNMAVADNLALEDEQIARREEWMASQILQTGAVILASDDFPSVEVDFGRHADLTEALTSTARWGETGVKPLTNLRSWAALVASKSGAMAKHVTFDPLAAELFMSDSDVREVLDNRRQATGSMELSGLVGGATPDEAVYLGSIGQFDFYQYQDIYETDAGVEQKMLPDYSVILGSPGQAAGVRTYGAIQDKKAGLKALSRFPKMWDIEDPSHTMTMTQSAPLPVIGRPNATFFATVR